MKMKYWVVPAEHDNSKLVTIGSSVRPRNAIALAPLDPLTNKPEDERWVQIENIEDEFGQMRKVATVNAALKEQLVEADSKASEARDAQRANQKKKMKAVKKKLKEFDKHRVVGLEQVQDQLDAIVEFLKDKLGFEGDE